MNRAKSHLPFLDKIRGLAILWVLVFHSVGFAYGFDHLSWVGWHRDFNVPCSFLMLLPATFGWAGVSIFFVVSGFCIHLSYQNSMSKDFRVFFARRFFRIWPPYFAALLIFSFIYPWHRIHYSSTEDWSQFFSHLFLIHNFNERWFYGINGVFWSIAVEIQLYLLYPVLLKIVDSINWTNTLLILGFVEVSIRIASGVLDTGAGASLPRWLLGSPVAFWFTWSIGARSADAFINSQPSPFCGIALWVFPLLTITSEFIRPLAPLGFIFVGLSVVVWIENLLKREACSGPGRWEPGLGRSLAFVGTISYSLYLLHQPFLPLIPRVLNKWTPYELLQPVSIGLICIVAWIPIFFFAWLFYRYVELPSIELGKRYLAGRRGGKR